MPNIKSAKKRVLVNKTKNLRNKSIKSNLKTVLKKTDAALATGENTAEVVSAAHKSIDKACAKGIMHKNKAARLKAQIAKKAAK